MPRDLDPGIQALIALPGTRPITLVEILYETPVRFTSLDKDVTWNGFSWISNGVRVGDIDESKPNSGTRCYLPNGDGAFTTLLETQGIEQEVNIYRTWSDSPAKTSFALGEVINIFSGIVGGAPSVALTVEFDLIGVSSARLIPFIKMEAPTNNANATVGIPIRFNVTTIQVVE